MKNKVRIFATENDTNFFAVIVDGFFGLFATKGEADAAYANISRKQHFDDSPFGSCEFLPPMTIPKYVGGYMPEGGLDKLSDHKAIDIANYIARSWSKPSKYIEDKSTPAERLAYKKAWKEFFGDREFSEAWEA